VSGSWHTGALVKLPALSHPYPLFALPDPACVLTDRANWPGSQPLRHGVRL